MAKQSPPMPVICGSITHRTAAAVTAASAALPPARSTSMAAKLASGFEVAAMPSRAITGERPGRWKSRIELKVGPQLRRSCRRPPDPAARSDLRLGLEDLAALVHSGLQV